MPGTPADHRSSPNLPSGQAATGNLSFLYQRHRSRLPGLENQLRPHPSAVGNHGLARQDSYGSDRLYKIYPKEIARPKSKYGASASNAITSPILSALGSTSSTAAQYTSDWARSLPFGAAAQQQLGSSPPPLALIPPGREHAISASSSPPNLRPQSHPNQYQSFGGRNRHSSQNSARRASLYSQIGAPYGHIPLPHEDQPHFHSGGLPDLDSIIPQAMANMGSGLTPGDKGYFCGFDTLSNAGHGPSSSAELVLLCGFEGGLITYKISAKMVQRIGLLENVRGGVIGAKILPWTLRSDPAASGRPFVALVVHGPVFVDDPDSTSSGGSDKSSDSNPSSNSNNRGHGSSLPDVVKHYQTTVEIYSLSTRKHAATVFESPLIPVEYSPSGEIRFPKPFGDLRVDAQGKFLVVASGESGEIFIYSPYTLDPDADKLESIRCVGKLWTTLQRREVKVAASTPSPGTSNHGSAAEEMEVVRAAPIFALGERWLALVPPVGPDAAKQFSVGGKAVLSPLIDIQPPGITSHAPFSRPETTCAIDVPEGSMGDSLVDKVSREVTQRVMKGAQWVSDRGRQAWNSYWSPLEPGAGPFAQGPQHAAHYEAAFPPTHGHNSLPASKASVPPKQVSIFDLDRFLEWEGSAHSKRATKAALTPLATFEPPAGCSHLEFAPHGYHLLTASRKGDEYTVWNLLRMVYPSPHPSQNTMMGAEPYVRQSMRLTRMTTASVADIIWDAHPPFHKKFAIVTGAGTIHSHLMPDVTFSWPPPRNSGRRARQRAASSADRYERPEAEFDLPRPATAVIGTAVGMASSTASWLRGVGAGASSAVSAAGHAARPKTLSTSTAAAVGTSTRAVRAGLTAGANMVANGANTMYHASENKLHVAGLAGADLGTGRTVIFFRGSKKEHARLLNGGKPKGKGDSNRRPSVSVGSASSANNTALYPFDDDDDDDADGPESGSKRACFLAVVAAGTLNVYPVKESSIPRKGMASVPLAAIGKRASEFALFKIADDIFAASFIRKVEQRYGGEKDNRVPGEDEDDWTGGEWLHRSPTPTAHPLPRISRTPSGLSVASRAAPPAVQAQQGLKPPKVGKKGKLVSYSPSPPTMAPALQPPVHGPRKSSLAKSRPDHQHGNNWHATVEAETNPPYRPFHTDGCVVQFNEVDDLIGFGLDASRETALAVSPRSGPSPSLSPSPSPGLQLSETPSPSVSPGPQSKKKTKKGKKAPLPKDVEEEIAEYDSHIQLLDQQLSNSVIRDMSNNISIRVEDEASKNRDEDRWVFGQPLPRGQVLFGPASGSGGAGMGALDSSNVIPLFGEDPYGEDVESDIRVVEGPNGEQVVVTTVRSRGVSDEDEFFEEGCEIVDWVDDRV